jgi:hypothetical protein
MCNMQIEFRVFDSFEATLILFWHAHLLFTVAMHVGNERRTIEKIKSGERRTRRENRCDKKGRSS